MNQMLHVFVHDVHKLVFVGIYDKDAKHYKKHASISGNYSKAKTALKHHKTNQIYQRRFDGSFNNVLLMTHGTGWRTDVVDGPYDKSTSEARKVSISDRYEKNGFRVVGNREYIKPIIGSGVGNKHWGEPLPINVNQAKFNFIVDKMFDPKIYAVDKIRRNSAFLVYVGSATGKQRFPGVEIKTKGDLYEFLEKYTVIY